jgi:cation diffusion facilitator CzcD-associated flavoprotein CzcO
MAAEVHVAVIGAGPYGLSCASYLRERGVDHVIFGSPMASWRETMPRGMLLKSDGFASSIYHPAGKLTLRQYCAEQNLPYADLNLPVPLATFVAYGLHFQKQLVPYLDERLVARLERQADSFVLELDDGDRIAAKHVIVATGINAYRNIPAELAHLPPEALTHSSDHNDPAALRGRKIVILGRGASAVNLAVLGHEAGAEVQLVTRTPYIEFHDPPPRSRPLWARLRRPTTGLGPGLWNYFYWRTPYLFRHLPLPMRLHHVRTALGPAPGWFFSDRAKGKFPIHLGYRIASARYSGGALRLHLAGKSEKRSLTVDHLIAGTGFVPDVARLPFIDPRLAQQITVHNGSPLLSRDFETSVPGLYFVGLPSAMTFGPVMRFAVGARYTAERLSRRLAANAHELATPWSPAIATAG